MAKTEEIEKLSIVMKSTKGLNIKFALTGEDAAQFKKLVAALISPSEDGSDPITTFD